MTEKCLLSNNTQSYLERFEYILHEMIRQMSTAPKTDSISGSFITQMIPHHRAAIEMSENLLRYTTNIPLQSIALNIISSQKQSIANMTSAFLHCKELTDTPQELAAYQAKNECILENMFHQMSSAYTDNNIDGNFMREMIPHHRGAIAMSENALHYPLCPQLIPLLNDIIVSQRRGIREMQRLLLKIRC